MLLVLEPDGTEDGQNVSELKTDEGLQVMMKVFHSKAWHEQMPVVLLTFKR